MSKKIKRSLSFVLGGIMILSMVGCGKGAGSNDDKKIPVNQSGDPLADFEKEDSFNYFNMAAGVTDEEFNAHPMAKLLEKETGYKVTYTQAPADAIDMQAAITNAFLLKQDYQAVKVSKDQFYMLLELGALYPITEHVEASTNLKGQISEFGWETATKDGEIYAIPQKGAMPSSAVGIAYRVDWLEEYNEANPDAIIPMPAEENGYSMTLSDYKTMLEFYATKVPQGGYAMGIDTISVFHENILPAFGIYQEWADVGGKLTYVIDQPNFEQYALYMQDLYDSGLVLYQATSGDPGAVKSLQSQMVGAGRIPHWNAFSIETADAPEGAELSEYTSDAIGYIQVLVPDDAKGDASQAVIYASDSYGYYTVIPNFATPKQVAAVMDWVDKKLDKDLFLKTALGTEGETFYIEDGGYYPILPAFDEEQGLADKFIDGSREDENGKYWLCRLKKTAAQYKMFSTSNYNIKTVVNPVIIMPPNEAYDTYNNAASIEVKNTIVTSMFQTGKPFDLSEIQDKWNEFEGKAIVDSVNEWYETWPGREEIK